MLLGWTTDCLVQPALVQFSGHEGYTVVQTRVFPGYHSGNYLFLHHPPSLESLPHWLDVWRREFAGALEVQKLFIQWESETPEPAWLEGVESLGVGQPPHALRVVRTHIFALDQLHPPLLATPPTIFRPVASEEDWQQVLDLALEEIPEGNEPWMRFCRWRFAEYRRRVEEGGGQWWGSFHEGTLWGSAGFFWHEGFARFQEVTTRAPERRRGVCTSLIHAIAAAHLARSPDSCLVIAAEPGSEAERIYSRLGFRQRSQQWSLMGDRS